MSMHMKITYTKYSLTKAPKSQWDKMAWTKPRTLGHMFNLSYFTVQQAETHTSLHYLTKLPLALERLLYLPDLSVVEQKSEGSEFD